MTLQEIKNLTLEDKFFEVLYRVIDFSVISNDQPQFEMDPDISLPMYDRLKLNVQIKKPTLQEMEADLLLLKDEMSVAEQARLDEIARIKALESRINALDNFHSLLQKAGLPNIPNSALEYKRIIDENDVAKLQLLESAHKQIKSEEAMANAARPMKELRELRDKMLKDTDFSQLADSPLTSIQKQEYQLYRSYLRSLPGDIESGAKPMQAIKTFKEFKLI